MGMAHLKQIVHPSGMRSGHLLDLRSRRRLSAKSVSNPRGRAYGIFQAGFRFARLRCRARAVDCAGMCCAASLVLTLAAEPGHNHPATECTDYAAIAGERVSFDVPSCPTGLPQTGVPQQAIKVNVTLVTVPVIVSDKDGKYIPGLSASDFHVYEDGMEQKIDRLVPLDEPFSVALMLDRSGSTLFKLEEIQQAAIAFVEALRPQDRVMVVSFDDTVHYTVGFTENRTRLRDAILRVQNSERRTALHDALERVQADCFHDLPGRKAMVLFTDGVDNASMRTSQSGTLAGIERSDVVVYAIQHDTRENGAPDRFRVPLPAGYESFESRFARAGRYLRDLGSRSGGGMFQAESIPRLKEAFGKVAEELARQYSLCYYPEMQARDGTYHRIRVTVDRPGAKVRARPGYRASTQHLEIK